MATVEDTFTEADGATVALEDHTADTGQGWVLNGGAGGTTCYEIDNNSADGVDDILSAINSTTGYYWHDDLASADHYSSYKTKDAAHDNTQREMYTCIRLSDDSNFIGHRWYGTGSNGSRVTKSDAGSLTDLITEDGSSLRNSWVKVEGDGDTIALYHGGTGSDPSYTQIASVTESFNNAETRQGFVKLGGGLLGEKKAQEYRADTLGGTVTDDASITSVAASILSATDTGAGTDNATITTVGATVLTGSVSTLATDAAAIITASASPLTAAESADSAVTDTALITSIAASVQTASEAGIATDTAAITSALAQILSAAETGTASDTAAITTVGATVLAGAETGIVDEAAAIITATASPLTSTESTDSVVTDTAIITSVAASTKTAAETGEANDGAGVSAATVTLLTSAETASALDNAVIVRADGKPLAVLDTAVTDESGQIIGISATPLTASDFTGAYVQELSGTLRVVPVLEGTASIQAKLRGTGKLH